MTNRENIEIGFLVLILEWIEFQDHRGYAWVVSQERGACHGRVTGDPHFFYESNIAGAYLVVLHKFIVKNCFRFTASSLQKLI